MSTNTAALLQELTAVTGTPFSDEKVLNLLTAKLASFGDVQVDAMHNISCTFGSGYHVVLEAHWDEICFVVTGVSDDGYVHFAKSGGIDPRILPGARVVVHGKRDLPGVISTLPPHLQKGEDGKKAAPIDELSIDLGLTTQAAKDLVAAGDCVTFAKHFTPLNGSRVSANCLDDRSGVAAVLLAAEQLKDVPCRVTLLFTAQEEVGTRGAKTALFDRGVDASVSVDVSFAYTPGCKARDCGVMGKGPMIGISPILDRQFSKELLDLAKENQIPYQTEVMAGRTGTNADAISICGSGVRCALVSIPEKYMHTPAEIVDTADVEQTAALLAADGTYTADALTGPLNGVYSAVTLEWDHMAADGGEGIFRRAKLTDLLAEYGADTCNGLVLVPFKCQLDDSDLTAEDYNAEGLLNYPVLADVGSIAINAGTSADGLKAAKSAALWLYSNGAGEDALTETLGVVTPWNTAASTTAVTAMQVQQVGTGILPGVALDTAAADALTANELTLQGSEKHSKAERTAFVDGALAALGAE